MNIDTNPIEAGLGFFIKPNKVSLMAANLNFGDITTSRLIHWFPTPKL